MRKRTFIGLEAGRTASSAGTTARPTRASPLVTVGRTLAFAEGVEAVAHREHEVTGEIVVAGIVYIVGGNRT